MRTTLLPQQAGASPKPAENIPLPSHCCALYPLSHWQGPCSGGDSRWDLEGGKCISQLYYLPFGLPFGVPKAARDGCCEEQLLPCAPRRNHQGPVEGHHAGTGRRTEFSLLELIQTRIHLLFPQQEALSSYHYNNECLQGYIASFIIIHP